jgi:NH3-dependent NAD+ synthetase
VSLRIQASREADRITAFIGRTVGEAQAGGVVLGLSGGIDSAVVGALCVNALGKDRVLVILMPSSHTPHQDLDDARKLADTWRVRREEIRISGIVDDITSSTKAIGTRTAKANVQARARMVLLYYRANSIGYLVAGTGDKSEELLGYFCYDSKTRVVTVDGPKGIDDLRAGDTVFSLDPRSREMVEARVENVHRFPYDGKLIHFKGRGTDVLVTPNHRMLVQPSSSTPDSPVMMRTAEDCLRFRKVVIPLPSGWSGTENLPLKIELSFKQRHTERKVLFEIEDAMYLFGLFIGDGIPVKGRAVVPVRPSLTRGAYVSNPRDNSGRFMLAQVFTGEPRMKEYYMFETDFALPSHAKEGPRKRLLAILAKYKIGYSLTRDLVRIPSKGIYEFFLQCGHGARDKHIPRWLLAYPSPYLFRLLRGLKDSDATHAENEDVYYASSERLKDDFVQLCFKIGRKATVSKSERKTSVINGKLVRSRMSYEITFARKARLQTTISNGFTSKVDYKGVVWCPSVPPYENVLVERNGRYMFSGNTKWGDGGADFLPIAHLYKTQVRELGAFLGLPRGVVEKPASPQLWPGQMATDEIPANYDRLDVVLHYLYDLRVKPAEAAAKARVPLRVVNRVLEMHTVTEHKRKLPPSLA